MNLEVIRNEERNVSVMILPIDAHRDEIICSVKESRTNVIVGTTGSGKTTRVPLFLRQAGFGQKGLIGMTEPRRIAAVATAEYLAQQIGGQVGDEVGYQVRFDNRTNQSTKIKVMTDGILLQEARNDPYFSKYAVLVIDEAHERSLNIDLILGLARRALEHNPDLRVVIMSATIDAGHFAQFFNNARVINVEGRTYPVMEHFLTDADVAEARARFTDPFDSYHHIGAEELATYMVEKIHLTGEPGDILVFLPGKGEIYRVMELLNQRRLEGLEIVAIHGEMSLEEQHQIFARSNFRRVDLTTNLAEASLTVPGVVHVVDSGLVREKNYNPHSHLQSLLVEDCSVASLRQRAGRAGRVRPGHYWPLFRKADMEGRNEFTAPEIARSDLAATVLQMIGLGITDVLRFPLLDRPSQFTVERAIQTLNSIGAIDGDGRLTEIGEQLLDLQVEPTFGRSILESVKHGCVTEVCTIMAALSSRDPFRRPKDEQERLKADICKYQLTDRRGDLLTYLNVVTQFEQFGRGWARDNYLNVRSIQESINIRDQLLKQLERAGIEISSIGYTRPNGPVTEEQRAQEAAITTSVLAGLIQNLLVANGRYTYRRVFEPKEAYWYGNGEAKIFPGSVLFHEVPHLLLSGSIVDSTSRRGGIVTYARQCAVVQVGWLKVAVPHLVTEVEEVTNWSSTTFHERITKINGVEVKREVIKEINTRASWIRFSDLASNARHMRWVFQDHGDATSQELIQPIIGELEQLEFQVRNREAKLSDEVLDDLAKRLAPLELIEQQYREADEARRIAERRLADQEILAELQDLRERLRTCIANEQWLRTLSGSAQHGALSTSREMKEALDVHQRDGYWTFSAKLELRSWAETVKTLEQTYTQWRAEQDALELAHMEEEEYQGKVEEFRQAGWPEFGEYRFELDHNGNPMPYRGSDFATYQYDITASEELPEAGQSYWGFVNQVIEKPGKTIKMIGLLLPVRETHLVGCR